MNSIENNFVPYQIALDMKSIGFDEPCFGFYDDLDNNKPIGGNFPCDGRNSAPTFSQCFRFFREEYGLKIGIDVWANNYEKWWYCIYSKKNGEWDILLENNNIEFYEEAELECLIKLIEIVKEKQL
jgi:hypothetical protein